MLMIFGFDFSVIALIGVILLIGIVKKNGIMMVDFAIAGERERGLDSARGDPRGLPVAVSADHDDHDGCAARRRAADARTRHGIGTAPAARLCDGRRTDLEPGADALHDAGGLSVSRSFQPDGCLGPDVRARANGNGAVKSHRFGHRRIMTWPGSTPLSQPHEMASSAEAGREPRCRCPPPRRSRDGHGRESVASVPVAPARKPLKNQRGPSKGGIALRQRLPSLRTMLMAAGILVVAHRLRRVLAARRALRLDRRRLCAGRQAVGVDRRVGHRVVGQRARRTDRQGRRPAVPASIRCQFQIALDNAKANLAQTALTIESMKADYKAHAERCRRTAGAGRRSIR